MLHIGQFTKNHLKLLSVFVVIIVGTFTFANSVFLSSVSATYVEGPITQDTIWTLIDSPFVVSKNVTVYPNATLTIEPGVEIRFGEDFSIIVEGQLIANGTQDRMVTFTSNKYQPETGDWNTIEFSGRNQSLLAYCSIRYAKTGITTENSRVELKNSAISNSSQYGISIAGSSTVQIQANKITNSSLSGVYISGNSQVTIQNNTIADNSQSGIYVTGDNQVKIQNNNITSNGDGILLTGTSISQVNIAQNIVLSNTQSGIHLNATAYNSLTILYNILSANNKGFYITGNASTQITNNSISYNSVGFFYAAGQGHQAHWNDIYGNAMGMDAYYPSNKSVEVVNATYNYWGDQSGPYHVSLNPAGKGNPVGGDGVNLVFIFFLTAPIGYIDHRPVARLLSDMTLVSPGQQVTFFATNSTADRRVDQYFFNFGDGQNSGWTTLSVFVHKYSSVGAYNATVKVMDDFGVVSDNLANSTITCQNLPPLTVSLIPSSLSISSAGQVSLTVQVTNATSPVGNANVILFSILGGSFAPSSGVTNSSGYFATTFFAPNVTLIKNIRIVASASKNGFADGSDYAYLLIQPTLIVNITSNPDIIKSEATTNVTISVTCNGAPVSAANVTASSNSTGRFDETIGVTDANGTCTFLFTAPQTSTLLEINIAATATKSGYLNGQGQALLTVEPKVLLVQVTPSSAVINSEMSSNITVRVVYDGNPVSDATAILSSDKGGSFSPTNNTTDANGECTFVFTAQVMTPTNITITATAIKTGYANGTDQTTITVNLGTLNVQVTANPAALESKTTSTVTVHVTYNARPVANAVVTVSSGVNGAFSVTNGTTDENGDCTFVFTAPQTKTQFSVTITATATKSGYIDEQSQTKITVNPAAAPVTLHGLPLTTILMIAAAIIVIAIVVILIKLKIIAISWRRD